MPLSDKLQTIGDSCLDIRRAIQEKDLSRGHGAIGTLADDIAALNPKNVVTKIYKDGEGNYGMVQYGISDSLTGIGTSSGEELAITNIPSGASLIAAIYPAQIKNIASNTFQDQSDLHYVNLENIEVLNDRAFWNADLYGSINLQNCINIQHYCFSGNSHITSVNLPNVTTFNGSTYAQGGAFENCTSLVSVNLNNALTHIGNRAFFGCTELSSITLPSGLVSTGERIFESCTSLTNVTFPEGVTTIGRNICQNCTALTSVVLPSTVTEIGIQTFRYCTALTSISSLPNITTLPGNMFYGCTALTSVDVGSNVTVIGTDVFRNCSSLVQLILRFATSSPIAYASNLLTGTNANLKIYVPYSADHSILNAYQNETGWSAYASKMYELNQDGTVPTT